jgi:protein-tyrosine phosphatase
MTRVLFVCLGNICRSPSVEGVFRKLVDDAGLAHTIEIDSAGTGSWHVGKAPDRRAQATAQQRDIDITGLRARQIIPQDFAAFDYLIAMDQQNLADLNQSRPRSSQSTIQLLLDFGEGKTGREVPDPYYGSTADFEHMFDLIEQGAAGLLNHIRKSGS